VVDAGITQQLLPPCPTPTGVLYGKAPIAACRRSIARA
jgi:hypothetical protein